MKSLESYIEIEKQKGVQISNDLIGKNFFTKKARALYPVRTFCWYVLKKRI